MSEMGLYDLPESWSWSKIGTVCETTSGGTPSRKKSEYYGGKIPWLKSGELNNNYIISAEEFITQEGLDNSSAKIFPKDTLLIALYGATVGKLGILNIDSSTNQAICAIFTPSQIFNKYLFWYLTHYRSFLLESRIGGAQPNISQNILRDVDFPLPPFNEQKRVIIKIEELFTKLDAGIQELTLAKEKLKIYRQSVLKHAFEGKLTEQWREAHKDEIEPVFPIIEKIKTDRKEKLGRKYKKTSHIDLSELKELPESWSWKRLGEITEIIMGQSPPGDSYNQDGLGTPLINGPVEFGPNPFSKTLKSKFTTDPKKMCKENDLILCVRGSTTGRMNISGFDACIGRGVAALRSYLCQPYLNLFIHSIQKDIFDSGTGSTFPNVTLNTLNDILIPIPSLIEQNEIVKEIEFNFTIIDNIEKNIEENLLKSQKLRQSILKKAFEGKLVPQDPNDKPAEKLLERIKAQKEKQKPKRKTRKKSKQKVLV